MINRICRYVGLLVMMACPVQAGIRWDQVPTPPEAGLADKDGVCLAVETQWAKPGQWAVPYLTRGVKITGFDPYAYQGTAVSFYVNRVVTNQFDQVDSDGFLRNPEMLIQQGVIAPTITVEFPILFFSSYINGQIPQYIPVNKHQIQLMSVNGKRMSVRTKFSYPFQGAEWDYSNFGDLRYKTITVEIPIAMVKFPIMRDIGQPSIPILNEIAIFDGTIDIYTGGLLPWVHVPWTKTTVKAMAPIVLVHGTNATPDTWDVPKNDSFNDYFHHFLGICFNDIALKPNGPVDANGSMLEVQIADRLASVGAKQCHIVAHSKGGNDSRSMIYSHYKSHLNELLNLDHHFEVLSLYTLDTPHRGTVLADISWGAQNAGDQAIRADPNWEDLKTLVFWDISLAHHTPSDDPDGLSSLLYFLGGAPSSHALRDNKTESMQELNKKKVIDFSHANMGRPIKFYNTAADADWHSRDRKIDDQENAVGSDVKQWPSPLTFLASPAYRMLYRAKEVRGDRQTPIPPGNVAMWKELYVYDQNDQGTWNDLVVAISSAKFDGGTLFCPKDFSNDNNILLGNHSGIKTASMAAAIVSQIRTDWTTW